MTSTKTIGVLIGLIIGGFFMTFVPDPLDIGEAILVSIASNCSNQQCIENSNNLLNSYHAGGLILGIGSIFALIISLKPR